jgi:predicted RecA/RadA family phage recombinase
MAQTQSPAYRYAQGDMIDYTPASAVYAGDVVVIGSIPFIAVTDIAANTLGSLAVSGVFRVPKETGALSAGDAIYWHTTGNPDNGTAGTGAANGTASGGYLMGLAVLDAASGDDFVHVLLTASKRTTTIAGSVTADDITGSDSSLAIGGIAAAQGGAIAIAGGASSTSSNAGGAVSVTGGAGGAAGVGGAVSVVGGVPASGNAAGGAGTFSGGAGGGTRSGRSAPCGDCSTSPGSTACTTRKCPCPTCLFPCF